SGGAFPRRPSDRAPCPPSGTVPDATFPHHRAVHRPRRPYGFPRRHARRLRADPERRVLGDPGAGALHDRPGFRGEDGVSPIRLRIVVPTKILFDETVEKVTADGTHGNFTILPRHTDFLAALVPGLLSFGLEDGSERFAAVDGGLLLKHGREVLVTTGRAVV